PFAAEQGRQGKADHQDAGGYEPQQPGRPHDHQRVRHQQRWDPDEDERGHEDRGPAMGEQAPGEEPYHEGGRHLREVPGRPASGTTRGRVRAAPSSSPTRSPLDQTPVARVTAPGNHWRTSAGIVGWLSAMPVPIRKVMANRTGTEGPSPRRTDATAMIARP